MDKLRVLIADDTVVYRKILSEAVESTGMAVVAHTASNGLIAVEWMEQKDIDVVLMDVFMPEMDGIEALKTIKSKYPGINVIMITGESRNSAKMTLEALESGAMDFILKPSESNPQKNIEKITRQLQILFTQINLKKIQERGRFERSPKIAHNVEIKVNTENSINNKRTQSCLKYDLVLIASSTGGPLALENLCSGFEADFDKPILIVQHMPPQFTKLLAESINSKCKLQVIEGQEGSEVKKGQIIIAPGGKHMKVARSGTSQVISVDMSPYVNGVRPAADVLFESAAGVHKGKNILAVVLTGMGSDGTKGVRALKEKCNCYCITQSESSCIVYGMPRSVFEAGLSDETADIDIISKRIQQIASGRS